MIHRDKVLPALRSARRFLATGRDQDVDRAKESVLTVVKNIFDAPPLGVDLDGTMTEAPGFFRMFCGLWPGPVYVVTYRLCRDGAAEDIRRLGIKVDDIFLSKSLADKARIIKEHGIKVYIDDQDECLLDVPDDVVVMKFRNNGNVEGGKWLYSEQTGKLI